MRRFELSDGKSHKFWEIEVSGAEVTTRWGRIGTDGQTKAKDLGTAQKAEAEATKQIASKVKKGYAEVGQSTARPPAPRPAAPAPRAPEPVEPVKPVEPVEPPDEDTFVLPSSWKARLHPRRGGAYVPDDAHDVNKLWARVAKAARRELGDGPSGWTLEGLTHLSEEIRPPSKWDDDHGNTALVRAMVETHGLAATVGWFLGRKPMLDGWRMSGIPGLVALRRAIAAAPEGAYTGARDTASRYLGRTERQAQAAAYLFPTEGWYKAVKPSGLLATCVDDPATASQLRSYYVEPGVLETLAVELGADAVPFLVPLLDSGDADARKAAARVLAELPYDEAVAALFDNLEDKGVLQVLPKVAERFPRRCLRLGLGRLATTKALEVHVASWVAQFPEAVDAVLSELPPEGRAAVARLREAHATQLPEATADELPALFTNPPWSRRLKKVAVVALTRELPAPRVVFSEEEEAIAGRMVAETEAWKSRVEEGVDRDDFGRHRRHDMGAWLAVMAGGSSSDRAWAEKWLLTAWVYGDRARDLVLGATRVLGPERAAELAFTLPHAGDATLEVLPAIAVPRTADYFLEALGRKTRRHLALAWAARHPEYAARAWIPAALGKAKAPRRLAEEALRRLAVEHGDAVVAAATAYGQAAVDGVEAVLDADPLEAIPRKPRPVAFWNPAVLPRPRLRDADRVLSVEHLEVLATVLQISDLDDPYAGVEVVKEAFDAESLADFAWALFEQWLATGADSKEGFAMTALGLLGNDRIAGLLTPMIRRWPGESQHRRAVTGLDVLLAIGTDVALMHLNGIAQKVKFKGIRDNARERIQALAESLNLTRDELADRLVPDLDLDESGTMVLDFGPRRFTVGFDEALRPFVRDEDGKRRKDLPKPGARDDAELAEPAVARFKQLKKDVRTLARLQVQRFESAMVTGRRWSQKDFQVYLVDHPLVIHLVRRLVWGVVDAEGGLVTTFRISEDRTPADADDEELELPPGDVVVVHPIDLSPEEAGAWGEVLADYEILQPFTQLGRPTLRISDAERRQKKLVRNPTRPVPIGRILGLLSRGWERGEVLDGGVAHWISMPLPDGQHEVRVNTGGAGIWTGMGAEQTEDPTIESVTIVERGSWDWRSEGEVTFEALPLGLISEILVTLEALHAP